MDKIQMLKAVVTAKINEANRLIDQAFQSGDMPRVRALQEAKASFMMMVEAGPKKAKPVAARTTAVRLSHAQIRARNHRDFIMEGDRHLQQHMMTHHHM